MAVAVANKTNRALNRKVLTISSKRQITIPQKFYRLLGFGNEAECVINGDELIIRPIRVNYGGEFAEQILTELINEGYSGDILLQEFKKRQSQVRPAVEAMIAKAEEIARDRADYETYADVFDKED